MSKVIHYKHGLKGETLCSQVTQKEFAYEWETTCPQCLSLLSERKQFDVLHNGYYLLIFNSDNKVVSWDGSHSKPKEVAKAQKIIESLGLGRPEVRTYKMIKLPLDFNRPKGQPLGETFDQLLENKQIKATPVKQYEKIKVNEEAIATLAPIIKAYKK